VKTPRVRSGLKVHPMIARLFGRLMRGVHAGEEKLIWNQPAVRSAPETIVLSSSAFQNGIAIPTRFAARSIGENQSPPLEWSNLPSGTAEIVLVMEDPDAPLPVTSMHLVVTAISPRTSGLPAGSLNSGTQSSQVRLGKGLTWEDAGTLARCHLRLMAPTAMCFKCSRSAKRSERILPSIEKVC
jgi:hypothetical protein